MHDNQRGRSRSGSRQRRNRGDGRGRGDTSYSSGSSSRAPQQPVKLSFWQKLAGFFGGGPKKAPTSRSRDERPERPERGQRGDRDSHRRFEGGGVAPTPRNLRKPEVVEVSSPKLYIGNLSFDATEGDLFELFNGVGQVQNAEIVSNKYTQKSKGFAFVTMLTVDEARRAVTELHDKDFMGRKLVVSGAKTGEGAPRQRDEERDEQRDEESAPSAT